MDALYELKDMLCEELEEYGKKDKLDVGGLDIVDKLAHTIKNLDKIIEAYDDDYSNTRQCTQNSWRILQSAERLSKYPKTQYRSEP